MAIIAQGRNLFKPIYPSPERGAERSLHSSLVLNPEFPVPYGPTLFIVRPCFGQNCIQSLFVDVVETQAPYIGQHST
jgi:hypothetical protein